MIACGELPSTPKKPKYSKTKKNKIELKNGRRKEKRRRKSIEVPGFAKPMNI